MPVPRVAIVGRPNVGKSSLLNLIAGAKVAIVDPTPGVTRDRVSIVRELESPDAAGPRKPVEFTDTGGYGVYTAEGARYDETGVDLHALTADIEGQIAHAVDSADLVLLCIDAHAGVTPADEEIAAMLRRGGPRGARPSGAPAPEVRVVATKVDGPKWEAHAAELSSLGFGPPLLVSSKSNYFRRDFLDALYASLPLAEEGAPPPADLRLAVIGKRNAGKSSLINAWAGEPRVIVSEIAGTTRDAIDVRLELDGRSVLAIDTAGLRKKKSFQGAVEWYAFDRAKRAIERAEVVVLVIDAMAEISQVDEQLAMLAQKAIKPVVLVVNKWDLAEGRRGPRGKPVDPTDYEAYLRKELAGLAFAPVVFASATEGLNLRGILDVAFELLDQAGTRVPTGQLNRLIRDLVETRGPSNRLGTQCRVFYAAQVATHPPTIALVVNHPDLFTANYERFLLNRIREELPFKEVPVRLLVRARSRKDHDRYAGGAVDASEPELRADALADMPLEADAYFDDDPGAR